MGEQKPKNRLNRENKKKTKKTESWKKPIKPIRIFKKATGLVRFQFYKLETKKTELNLNKKKPSQIKKTKLVSLKQLFF
jgi:hypothetical protein